MTEQENRAYIEALQEWRAEFEDEKPRWVRAKMGREAGKTYRAIGEELGVTMVRVRQIVMKADRWIGRRMREKCESMQL